VTRRGPEFQLRIAGCPDLQQVVVAAVVQLEPGDRLPVAPIEAFGESQNRCERSDSPSRALAELAESDVLPFRSRAAMISRHEREDVDFLGLEATQIAVLDQVVRMLVVAFVADVHADVV
jgi:hypothetical protein